MVSGYASSGMGGAAALGQTVESSIVYPGDIAPGCSDPCAPCAFGTVLYDAVLCGHDACSVGAPTFSVAACANLLAQRYQTPLIVALAAVLGIMLVSRRRRR